MLKYKIISWDMIFLTNELCFSLELSSTLYDHSVTKNILHTGSVPDEKNYREICCIKIHKITRIILVLIQPTIKLNEVIIWA
jgi:hypothetical protein